jgi:cytoskeletal protein CcmA (bactofilin family)
MSRGLREAMGNILGNLMSGVSIFSVAGNTGNRAIEAETLESISWTGRLKLNGTCVTGATTVRGHITADTTQFRGSTKINGRCALSSCIFTNKTLITGDATVNKSTFNESTKFDGKVDAKDSQFKKQLTVCLSKGYLSSCHLNEGVVVEKNNNRNEQQTLVLANTVIEGNIVFVGGRGVIEADSSSQINGEIIGLDSASASAAGNPGEGGSASSTPRM